MENGDLAPLRFDYVASELTNFSVHPGGFNFAGH
jgi:hypothetical protein